MKSKFSIVLALALLGSSLYAAPRQNAPRQTPPQRVAPVPQPTAMQRFETRMSELEERVDEAEFQTGLDKIKFGLDFSLGVGDTTYDVKESLNSKAHKKYKAHNKWASELFLNMSAAINDYTKFYGRLSMSKNWGQMDVTNVGNPLDIDAGRNPRTSGSSIYVSRAYIDLFATEEVVFTLGRQPGTEGPGSNLRNNALRQSTYPALAINTLGDAAVVTFKPVLLSDFAFAVRGAYGKVYQYDEEGIIRDWSGATSKSDADLWYASAEMRLPFEQFGVGNNLLMLSYVRLNNFSLPLGATLGGVRNLGNSDIVNLHFEAYNLWDIGLNYFGSLGYYKGSDAKELAPGTRLFNEKNAYAAHVGLRYDFNQYFKLGGEYFYGSRFWYTLSRSSFNDPLNIRQTRGHAFDVYAIAQVDKNQFFRLSYTRINNLWGNRGLPINGAPGKNVGEDSTADNIMLVYNVKF
ncbi:DUF3373 family protein [Campylobacter sp. MIT 97-5078]|uniref:DUF3373 family protein n=1 Tax=Campylobacter sp. MIT 97-5078 TaxID=1548153 RepID=UPI000513E2B2|nr:DUF3373 family protein [Campylobacter sp. MIT 97-5078]KGI56315.1 hypothetical protein LR59_07770 [Campylobacter sp. MIT 97-5078]KGI57556.1 hypothetical protein LR59_02370 [Campylobacter sp. MIT 97-5078]KGI57747.1 hypothetical protein LR59_03445 [Campylobacter sp. MIT 97-5078]TQR26920.1 DUF3373 domain-containing protein [Campylobacter sp. MIT 97-5078]